MLKIFDDEDETFMEKLKDKFGKLINPITSAYRSVRCWLRFLNRQHLKLIWKAVIAYPWDQDYVYDVQLAQLEYILHYMEKRPIATPETYDNIIRYIKLAIKLNPIAAEKEDGLFDIDGEIRYLPVDGHPDIKQIDMSDCVYRCNVNVNARNMKRFVPIRNYKFYTKHLADLYVEKARHLYFKIFDDCISTWWD